jgi:glucose/arabinose dehydrogenase
MLPAALALAALPAVFAQSSAASCSLATVSGRIAMPSVAPGYSARLVASGLQRPRGIIVDNQDRLLVIEQRQGVRAITWNDQGGNCLEVDTIEEVENDPQV